MVKDINIYKSEIKMTCLVKFRFLCILIILSFHVVVFYYMWSTEVGDVVSKAFGCVFCDFFI